MKANELRIGNAFEYYTSGNYKGDEWVFNVIDAVDILLCQNDNSHFNAYYRPIPLTHEVLEKCGFESNVTQNSYDLKDAGGAWGILSIDNDDYSFALLANHSELGYASEFRIKYLHQLQNLYFALTGEELEYQP